MHSPNEKCMLFSCHEPYPTCKKNEHIRQRYARFSIIKVVYSSIISLLFGSFIIILNFEQRL